MISGASGSSSRPLRIAVIGSGPSGFYAAEELLSHSETKTEVDMFDRLPTPYGLVRGGVAPDHPKIKSVTMVYEKTASKPGFRFFGNVEFGQNMTLRDFNAYYDAVIFAVGAKSDRRMDIPGEDLKGSHPATEFVGWYNGHPDYQNLEFDLSVESAAVVGNGNVAIDVTRILAKKPQTLHETDIITAAEDVLNKSSIRTVYLLGRRGPVQAAFTNPEIRELTHLENVDLVVDPREMELDPLSKESLEKNAAGPHARNNVQLLLEQSQKGPGSNPKKIIVKFLVSPVELVGQNGRVTAIKIEKNRLFKDNDGTLRPRGTGVFETLPVGLVLRSVGYKGVALPGVPFDDKKGVIPNRAGRVLDPQNNPIPGLYVVGWAKRGPSGVVGTNKPDSIETVHSLLADLAGKPADASPQKTAAVVLEFLKTKNIHYVDFADWKALDRTEVEAGKAKGKSREKFTRILDMINFLKKKPPSEGPR